MATLHLLKIDPTSSVARSGMVDFIKRCQASNLLCVNRALLDCLQASLHFCERSSFSKRISQTGLFSTVATTVQADSQSIELLGMYACL